MHDQRGGPWRIRSSRYAIHTKFLRLRADEIELPDGTIIEEYYVRESYGFVVIFAQRPDGQIVLVRQYKHGAGRAVLELPAGAIEEDEDPAHCAARELAEETGYIGEAPELVRTFLADPTNSNGSFHLYLVRRAEERVATAFDPTEDIAVELATPTELLAMIRDGRIEVGSHVASIYTALDALGLLPSQM